jgi:hypothetical protein
LQPRARVFRHASPEPNRPRPVEPASRLSPRHRPRADRRHRDDRLPAGAALAERFRIPGLIGLIVAGALFGPHGLGILARDATIVLLGTVGLLYLVFLAGLELDLHRFAQFRRRSIVFGLLSFGIPMALAVAVMPMLGVRHGGGAADGVDHRVAHAAGLPDREPAGAGEEHAVTMVVGGTLVTDTLALGVLAVVAGSIGGDIGLGFWLRLLGGLALYVGAGGLGRAAARPLVLPRTPGSRRRSSSS